MTDGASWSGFSSPPGGRWPTSIGRWGTLSPRRPPASAHGTDAHCFGASPASPRCSTERVLGPAGPVDSAELEQPRLLISHVLLPTESPEAAGRDFAEVACRCVPGSGDYQPIDPGTPLNGPAIQLVTHPP